MRKKKWYIVFGVLLLMIAWTLIVWWLFLRREPINRIDLGQREGLFGVRISSPTFLEAWGDVLLSARHRPLKLWALGQVAAGWQEGIPIIQKFILKERDKELVARVREMIPLISEGAKYQPEIKLFVSDQEVSPVPMRALFAISAYRVEESLAQFKDEIEETSPRYYVARVYNISIPVGESRRLRFELRDQKGELYKNAWVGYAYTRYDDQLNPTGLRRSLSIELLRGHVGPPGKARRKVA